MPTSRTDTLGFPQSHAIVIGIGHYPLIEAHLKNAAKDAKDIAELLKKSQGFDKVLLMTDPTKVEIMALFGWLQDPGRAEHFSFPKPGKPNDPRWEGRSKIEWLKGAGGNGPIKRNRVRPDKAFSWPINTREDSILVYFAGHGIPGEFEEGPAGFLVPSDGSDKLKDNSSMVQMGHLYKALKRLDCLHTLLVLDCCFAGKFRFSDSTRFKVGTQVPKMFKQRFDRYKSNKAWQVLVSCGPDQKASDSASWLGIRDNSPFADTIKKALRGDADLIKDGIITAEELKLYVRDKVESIKEGHKPQYPDLFHMAPHRGGEFLFLGDGFDEEKLEDRPLLNPYKGLRSFTPEDKPWFFGREEALKLFIQKTHATSFLVVSGASAVGKSSFAKAGVYPKLQDDFGFEELVELRPGAKPWSGKGAVASSEADRPYFTGLKGICEALAPSSGLDGSSVESTVAVLDPSGSHKKRLLLIDQFEEVFTECKNPKELDQFAKALVYLSKLSGKTGIDEEGKGALRVVLTLRSDFEWQLETMAFLGKHLQEGPGFHYHLFHLHPPSQVEIREALTRPAGKEVWEFEEGLVDQIIEDINNSPAAFPLMSFAMGKLFDLTVEKGQRDEMGLPKRVFTQHLYNDPVEGVGGIVGALRGSADKLYLGFGPEDGKPEIVSGGMGEESGQVRNNPESLLQATMRKIILRLIQANEGSYTRRRVFQANGTRDDFISELEYPEGDSMVEQVLEALEGHQLIIRGKDLNNGQDYVELAHDSLITNWPRCQQWIKDSGNESMQLRLDVWQAVVDNHKPSQLNREINGDVSPTYLWDNNPKLQRILDLILDARHTLQKKENELYRNVFDQMRNDDLNEEDWPKAKERLFEWIEKNRILKVYLKEVSEEEKAEEIGKIKEGFHSGDPDHFFNLLIDNCRHWLNMAEVNFIKGSWEKRKDQIARLTSQRNNANFSLAKLYEEKAGKSQKNGELSEAWLYILAALNQEIGTKHLPVATGRFLLPGIRPLVEYDKGIQEKENSIWSMGAYQKGGVYAIGSSGYRIDIIDAKSHELRDGLTFEIDRENERFAAIFRREGFNKNPINLIWRLAIHPTGDFLAFIVTSNAGNMIRSGTTDPHPVFEFFFVWDLRVNQGKPEVKIINTYKQRVTCLAYHPLGTFLAVSTSANAVFLYETQTYRKGPSPLRTSSVVKTLDFTKDGSYLIMGQENGELQAWDMKQTPPRPILLGKHNAAINCVTIIEEAGLVISGSDDKKISVWDLSKRSSVRSWEAHPGPVSGIACNETGTLIFSSSGNSLRIWDKENGALLAQVQTLGSINDFIFLPAAQSLLLGTIDGKIQKLDLYLELFKKKSEKLLLEDFLLCPWKSENRKYIQNLFNESLEKLAYKFEDSALIEANYIQMLEAKQQYFQGEKVDENMYNFSPSNLHLFTNQAARDIKHPRFEDNTIIFTQDGVNAAATAVFLKAEVLPPFSIEFEFSIRKYPENLTKGGWKDKPADGISFLFLKDISGYEADIPWGSSRGFISDGKGYGVIFKIFDDDAILFSNGFGIELADSKGSKSSSWKKIYSDGAWRKVNITVEEESLEVIYEGDQVINWEGSFDFSFKHLGFGASCGAANAEHKVRNILLSKR